MLELRKVSKTYITNGNVSTRALNNVSLTLEEKGLVYILGKSGSGKSTLLNILSGLDKFDKGDVLIYGNSFKNFKEKDYDFYRNTFVGFVFQEFNLIQNLSVYENVELALSLQNKKNPQLIKDTLKRVGLLEQKDQKGFQLSGGQVQRTAIARSIIKGPKVLFADEPTGSLDRATSDEIIQIFSELSKEILVVIVSHNRDDAAKYADRIIEVEDGRIIKDLALAENETQSINNSKAKIIGEKIVVLEKGNLLEENELNRINDLLLQERRDYYVSVEEDVNKVKAYYPYLREAISNKIDADNMNEENAKFAQYQNKEETFKEINLIHSHLPFLKGLKLGASYLRVKVFRLIVTLILAISSVVLYGIGDNFSHYDLYYALAKSTKSAKINYVEVISSSLFYPQMINNVEETFKKDSNKSFSVSLVSYSTTDRYPIFHGSFSGLIEIDSPNDLGYHFLGRSDSFYKSNAEDGVVISSLAAYYINKRPGYLYNNLSDLIDKNISISGIPFKIIGIIDVNHLSILNYSSDPQSIEFLNEQIYSKLFVKKGFIESFSKYFVPQATCYLPDNITKVDYVRNVDTINKSQITITNPSDEPGIYIPTSIYNSLNGENYLTMDLNNSLSINLTYDSFLVKGHFNTNTIYMDSELFHKEVEGAFKPTSLFFNIANDSLSTLTRNYRAVYKKGFYITGEVISAYIYTGIGFTGLGNMFQIFALIVFLLVVILLYSFMLFSIKEHTKQIGILRSIGANKMDIVSVFLLEAAIIACITIVSSIIVFGIVSNIINNMAGGNSLLGVINNVKIVYATFSFSSIIKMIGVTIVVVSISLILPLLRIMKMQPVEAIREKSGN